MLSDLRQFVQGASDGHFLASGRGRTLSTRSALCPVGSLGALLALWLVGCGGGSADRPDASAVKRDDKRPEDKGALAKTQVGASLSPAGSGPINVAPRWS